MGEPAAAGVICRMSLVVVLVVLLLVRAPVPPPPPPCPTNALSNEHSRSDRKFFVT